MAIELIREVYKCTDVKLASGAVVNTIEVQVRENKVNSITNAQVKIEDKSFTFSLFSDGRYTLNGVPNDIDGQAIMREFIEYVEKEIVNQ